jgi:hypothetical protein
MVPNQGPQALEAFWSNQVQSFSGTNIHEEFGLAIAH